MINDRFEEALEDLKAIVRSERLRTPRSAQRHQQALRKLLGETEPE